MWLASLLVAAQLAGASPENGRAIYFHGAAANGEEIRASLGDDTPDVSAALLPCVNCHGAEGAGNAEGVVIPTNIRWSELTKPYTIAASNGRRRPPYDERSFARAITEGLDPAAHPLGNAMPRYRMSPRQIDDLLAFLRILGAEKIRGVTSTTIRIGVPFVSDDAAAGESIARVLKAYFAERGEIHGRRIVVDSIALARPDLSGIEQAVRADPPLVLIAPSSRSDQALADFAFKYQTPLFTPFPVSDARTYGFSLYSGLADQQRALAHFVAEKTNKEEPVIADCFDRLSRPPDAVLIARPNLRLDDCFAGLEQQQMHPFVLLLPPAIPKEPPVVPQAFRGRLLAAVPMLPSDVSAEGIAAFHAFAARNSLPGERESTHRYAYAAAQLIERALVDSGRDVRGDALTAALEKLYKFETGVTPPVTFTRQKHTAIGVTILSIEGTEIAPLRRE